MKKLQLEKVLLLSLLVIALLTRFSLPSKMTVATLTLVIYLAWIFYLVPPSKRLLLLPTGVTLLLLSSAYPWLPTKALPFGIRLLLLLLIITITYALTSRLTQYYTRRHSHHPPS